MRKQEICWAIFSGKVMLPWTIRDTRKECIYDRTMDCGIYSDSLPDGESCRKVVITEYKKGE